MLFIGFSCTGKTSISKKVFGIQSIQDSDDEVRRWIEDSQFKKFDNIFKIYMHLGRDEANRLIEMAEEALINNWANDDTKRIISLGPGFPFRNNWIQLRKQSYVVLLRRSPEMIYTSLKKRRDDIFKAFPEAKEYDNWDVDVLVDNHKREFSQRDAIMNIKNLITQREEFYRDNDKEICTDKVEIAIKSFESLKIELNYKCRESN